MRGETWRTRDVASTRWMMFDVQVTIRKARVVGSHTIELNIDIDADAARYNLGTLSTWRKLFYDRNLNSATGRVSPIYQSIEVRRSQRVK